MNIPLGFEIGTGRRISVPLAHTVVTGQTQKSGKTTTLEALITRSGLRAVAFVTKRGEKSFRLKTPIRPYFRERADWQFVQALLEAAMRTPMQYKEAWIMRACEGAKTLGDVQENIRRFLVGEHHEAVTGKGKRKKTKIVWTRKPATGLNGDMYYVLNHYFEQVLPEIKQLRASDTLELRRGVNVMDLSGFSFPMQALVIRSVIEWVYLHESGVIVIIPEAWEFIPRARRSPVKLAAEELIRKGAAEKNYIWLDSQDIAGVARELLRQMQVWILGVQRDAYEVKRTLDSIPDLGNMPRPEDVATLGKGEFLVAFEQTLAKVYVQPAGMEDAHAEAIALGEERPESWNQIVRTLDDETTQNDKKAENDQQPEAEGAVLGVNAGPLAAEANGNNPEIAVDWEGASEAMWKEKFEELQKAHVALSRDYQNAEKRIRAIEHMVRENVQTTIADKILETTESPADDGHDDKSYKPVNAPGVGAPSNGETENYELTAQGRVNCLAVSIAEGDIQSAQMWILQLARTMPELRVRVETKTLDVDDSTMQGRLALLLEEGFFKDTRGPKEIMAECVRRGWYGTKTPLSILYQQSTCGGLVDLGFLTKEDGGFKAVPGMKVTRING